MHLRVREIMNQALSAEVGGLTVPWPASILSGGKYMRVRITLACTECKQRNYDTMKNKKNDPDRLEMRKYCRFCKTHTVHRETR